MAKHKHLFITDRAKSEKFKQASKQGGKPIIPIRNREAHSQKLLQQFDRIWEEKEALITTRSAESIATREGTYLSFTSGENSDLITKSLESIKKGIRLLNIKEEVIGDGRIQTKAIVYIPNGMEGFFIKKILDYQTKTIESGKPQNAPLIDSIEDVSIALLEGLWTDNSGFIPKENAEWCEVWLNVGLDPADISVQLAIFGETLTSIGVPFKPNPILFPERAVILIKSNRAQLLELMQRSDLLAEFRAGQETAGFWMNGTAIEQQEWVEDLLRRVNLHADSNNIFVVLLDTGANNAHLLLQPILDYANTLTVDPTWGTDDHYPGSGHGTLMAGLAGYGNFEKELVSGRPIVLTHKLCSVKILPPPTAAETPKELWGYMTAQGISRAEIQNPQKVLLFCLAVTSTTGMEQGRPSSWSGEIDNLAFGDSDNQRLIVVSAGNIIEEDLWRGYPDSNFVSSIESPAQAWNSLTVGAYTEKHTVRDMRFNTHSPVALPNELSPYSTTSILWEKKWPVKPDVVFEGGNLLKAPDGSIVPHDDLDMLSTSKTFNLKPFDTINATSAASAQASWFAAKIAFEYPDAWAETIRGLIVHSAKWSPAMLRQMQVREGNKGDYRRLLQVFGYGVPDFESALYSTESALTYISQEKLQPFGFNDEKKPETNDLHFYSFPWPKELLLSMGAIPVTLRVTLSYFVEPGAGEIGWKDKYRYQSHGLRFDVNNVDEDETAFRKRINVAARDEGEKSGGNSGSDRWILGSNNRSTGSIHSDFWEGTAAELATCNLIAIYPVIGWWRERKHLNKVETEARYSLIISLITPAQDIELYTTVKTMIEIPVTIETR